MLPAQHRMRRSEDFGTTVRRGRRVGGPVLVVHHVGAPASAGADDGASSGAAALVGLVVGKSVGSSVIRHRVSRRLRAQLARRVDRLAPGSSTVVRALPAAATATSEELGRALDRGFDRVVPSVHR